jgi:hypothetical protein
MVKIRSPWAFPNSFNLLEPFSCGIFVKSFFNQILVEQGKVQLLLKKPCHFSEKKINQKSGIRFGILKYFFLQTCILRNGFQDTI